MMTDEQNDEREDMGDLVVKALRQMEGVRSVEVASLPPVPAEPEVVSLWRQVIEFRDYLATSITGWEQFRLDQRNGFNDREAVLVTECGERGVDPPDRSEAIATHDESDQLLADKTDYLRKLVAQFDAEVCSDDQDREVRRFKKVKKLIDLFRNELLADVFATTLLYLGKNGDRHETLLRAMVLRYKHAQPSRADLGRWLERARQDPSLVDVGKLIAESKSMAVGATTRGASRSDIARALAAKVSSSTINSHPIRDFGTRGASRTVDESGT